MARPRSEATAKGGWNVLRIRFGATVIALILTVLIADAGTGVAGAEACAGSTVVAADDATRSQAIRAVVCLVNSERAQRGLRRLRRLRQLNVAARFHSRDMVNLKYFGHHGPAGDDLAVRLHRSGYAAVRPRMSASEALAWGTEASAQFLVQALMGSPVHRSMLLNPRAREIGVGLTLGAPEEGIGGPASTLVLDFGE
jgi:uncharacterized protein YkwD